MDEKYIYIRANSSEDMIDDLRSRGISAKDCNVSAWPVVSCVYDNQGRERINYTLNPDYDYGFVKRDGKIYFTSSTLAYEKDVPEGYTRPGEESFFERNLLPIFGIVSAFLVCLIGLMIDVMK